MKYSCILILMFFNVFTLKADDYKLKLILEGKEYETVYIQISLLNEETEKIIGQYDSKDDSWNFVIPDSICEDVTLLTYRLSYDEKDNVMYAIDFRSVVTGDTVKYRHSVIDRNIGTIRGTYLYTKESPNISINGRMGKLSFDSFLISYPENTEWDVLGQYPIFGFFAPQNESEVSFKYQDFLKQYIEVVRRYPNSTYLMSFVYQGRHRYKSLDDLAKVYCEFSDSIQTSKIGILLGDFISNGIKSDNFENTEMFNSKTNCDEPIIQDTSKFNLVIFSASWCMPCHKLIPDLKNINLDLEKN